MTLNAVLLLCLITWPSVQASRQVTLTCGSDPDDVMTRVIPGPPGKRGVAGAKGDAGEKGEKGENDNSSAAIARLERKVSQLENQLSKSQRAERGEKMKRRRNGNQVVVLAERVVQLEEKLADLERNCSALRNSISMIQNVNMEKVQNPTSDSTPMNCRDVYASGDTTNGVYNITINGNPVQVYCDMETSGGGWTVFQKRRSREVDFNYNWSMYKMGFGNLNEDFWLGLDNIHHFTNSRRCKLHVDILTRSNEHQYAMYSNFSIEDESDNYRLRVSGYSGTAADGLTEHPSRHFIHDNMQFSTKDRDNDRSSSRNCASICGGGWWFNACLDSCSNCQDPRFRWNSRTIRSSTMKLRCD